MTQTSLDELTIKDIASLLNDDHSSSQSALSKEVLVGNYDQIRPAAVLIPLLRQGHLWHVLLTRRHENLPDHSGQVAFPGGQMDPDDSTPIQTALREAQEEIGLNPMDVMVLGQLSNFITITKFNVTPVIGYIPWPYQFKLAEAEVTRAFTIPLTWLANPNNYIVSSRKLHTTHNVFSEVIHYHPYDGEVLWGVSARFVQVLISTLTKK